MKRFGSLLPGAPAAGGDFALLVESLPVGVLAAEAPSGRILYGNRRLTEILRHPVLFSESVADYGEWVGWYPDGSPVAPDQWPLARALAGETVPEHDVLYRRGDGTFAWIRISGAPLYGADGSISGGMVTVQDVDAERRAVAALADSEQRLRTLMEANPIGVVLGLPDGRLLEANSAYLSIVGREREDLASGRVGWDAMTPPEWLEADARAIAQARDTGVSAIYEKEYLRPDGQRVPVLVACASLGGGDDGQLAAFVVDLSDRKRAERQRELLMREVDHRAKNALAVVLSLVRLTPKEPPGRFATAVEGRVSALARAHTLLARNRWTGVDLHDLLRETAAESDAAIGMEGPPVTIAAEGAQSMGMVLHELTANALTHGSLSRPGGRVAVTWGWQPAGGVRLTWVESGGPPVAPPTRRGFGGTLVDRMVAGQLRGTILFDWQPSGLAVTLTLPADTVLSPPGQEAGVPPAGRLSGRRVLVVEDNALIALALESTLAGIGCQVVGPAATLAEAETLAATPALDAALLDVNLGGASIAPVADALRRRGVPFVYITGYGEVPAGSDAAPLLRKPFTPADLTAALTRLLG